MKKGFTHRVLGHLSRESLLATFTQMQEDGQATLWGLLGGSATDPDGKNAAQASSLSSSLGFFTGDKTPKEAHGQDGTTGPATSEAPSATGAFINPKTQLRKLRYESFGNQGSSAAAHKAGHESEEGQAGEERSDSERLSELVAINHVTLDSSSRWGLVPWMAVSEQVFSTEEDAVLFVMDETQRGGPAIAVRLRLPVPADHGELLDQLVWSDPTVQHNLGLSDGANEAQKLAVAKLAREEEKAVGELLVPGDTERLVRCETCASRLAAAYLRGTACPLCATELLGPERLRRLTRSRDALLVANEKAHAAHALLVRTYGDARRRCDSDLDDLSIVWVVGATTTV